MPDTRTVNVYITTGLAQYLAQESLDCGDLVITDTADDGTVIIANVATCTDEGAGVWVDAAGREHLEGSHEPLIQSDRAVTVTRRLNLVPEPPHPTGHRSLPHPQT